ncbi:melatonin receptor type 1C-like [Stylophora pistillata]|uniref:melatonin receptor type 1C-like n=1 Tax=Stylophora pistillata TaxID=50429 RepID=UPI000C03D78C|nr:melatonin receptor type 1C-like [Stylophora pistillata]
MSLAMSDLAMLVLQIPPFLSPKIAGRWLGGFYLCQISGYSVAFLASVSLQTMALMALDRHFRIAHPLRHRTLFNMKRTKVMTVASWMFSSTVQLPYVANGGIYTFHSGKCICFVDSSPLAIIGISYIVIPSFIVHHFYLKVYLALRARKRRVENLQSQDSHTHMMTTQEIKLTKTIMVTVLAYAICWAPVMITDLVDQIRGGWALPRGVYVMYTICGIASSCINPVIYGIMNKSFRREYIRLLR